MEKELDVEFKILRYDDEEIKIFVKVIDIF